MLEASHKYMSKDNKKSYANKNHEGAADISYEVRAFEANLLESITIWGRFFEVENVLVNIFGL